MSCSTSSSVRGLTVQLKCDWPAPRQIPQLAERLAQQLAGQVVQGDIDSGSRHRHARTERRADRPIHDLVRAGDIGRIVTDQLGGVIVAEGHGGRLERLVAPCLDGNTLSPADSAVVGRDLHDHGCPSGLTPLAGQKLEEPLHWVTAGKYVDAIDLHLAFLPQDSLSRPRGGSHRGSRQQLSSRQAVPSTTIRPVGLRMSSFDRQSVFVMSSIGFVIASTTDNGFVTIGTAIY